MQLWGSLGAHRKVKLEADGHHVNALRVRSFPFSTAVEDFIHEHDKVFIVEQNRDAQLKQLLVNEAHIEPSSLVSILHYDGTPITARYIVEQIVQHAGARTVVPFRKAAS